jgi:hypothetical protein
METNAMRVLRSLIVVLLFAFAGVGQAPAQTADVENMPIRIGDTIERVREAYQTRLEPEPFDSIYKGATALRLKTRGVWFFFDRNGRIYTIRLDAPFAGTIKGIRIGDTAAKVLDVLGQPIIPKPPQQSASPGFLYRFDDEVMLPRPPPLPKFGPPGFLYRLDDDVMAKLDLDDDNQVETVFLSK